MATNKPNLTQHEIGALLDLAAKAMSETIVRSGHQEQRTGAVSEQNRRAMSVLVSAGGELSACLPPEARAAMALGFTYAEATTETGYGLRRIPGCRPTDTIAAKLAAGALSAQGAHEALADAGLRARTVA